MKSLLKDLDQLEPHEVKKLVLRLSLALKSSNIGVWDWDLKTNLTSWDQQMFDIYGLMEEIPMPYEKWLNCVLPEDRSKAVASLEDAISQKKTTKVSFRILKPNGYIRHIQASAGVMRDELGEVIHVIGINIDKTDETVAKEFCFFDGLTGIANRRAYDQKIESEIATSERTGSPLSLLIIDIDNFKQYNDNYGHIQGDDALTTIAECLSSSIKRKTDMAARYGGDEFAVLLVDTPLQGAKAMAEQILSRIKAQKIEHAYSDVSAFMTVSIGISSTEISRNNLIEHTDKALYQAKENGRQRCEIYTPK